jgi:hypothetical protein
MAVTTKSWTWSRYVRPVLLPDGTPFPFTSVQVAPYAPELARRIKRQFPEHWRHYKWESIAKFLREGPRLPRGRKTSH